MRKPKEEVKKSKCGKSTFPDKATADKYIEIKREKIGDKFQNTLRYNNQSAFGFEGQRIRLAYNGKEDEIIRNLEAGDVSFEVPTQLIKSANSLWGIKTELQFGKLNIKTALSQQRSTPQSKTIENGKEIQNFEITVDQYDQFPIPMRRSRLHMKKQALPRLMKLSSSNYQQD